MSTNTVYLKDKNSNIVYPASDWSVISNKPSNLATTSDLGTLADWSTAGITFSNGGYPWAGTSEGGSDNHNCAYRIADFGSFKMVELRIIFGTNNAVSSSTTFVNLPTTIQPDWDLQSWYATYDPDTTVWFSGSTVGLSPASGKSTKAGTMYSFSTTYFTTA